MKSTQNFPNQDTIFSQGIYSGSLLHRAFISMMQQLVLLSKHLNNPPITLHQKDFQVCNLKDFLEFRNIGEVIENSCIYICVCVCVYVFPFSVCPSFYKGYEKYICF